MLKIVKNNYKYLILSFILLMISIFTFRSRLDSSTSLAFLSGYGHRYVAYLFIIILGIIISFAVYKVFNKQWKLENIFLTFIIPLGLLYIIVIPIGRVPDENNHFYRAYEISKGYLVSEKNEENSGGNYFSSNFKEVLSNKNTYTDELNNISIRVDSTSEFYSFSNTSLYSLVSYIPQVIGIKIASILNLPILFIALFGRITNFACWVLLMYFSLKVIPFKKYSVLLVAFLPMMLQEACSLSADALTNGATFLLISYILYLRYNDKNKIEIKDKIILSILAIIVSLCKIVYIPLCLLLFLIPDKKFKTKKSKYIEICTLALVVIIINLIWLYISSSYLIEFNEGVNSADQVIYILSNPFKYIEAIFTSIYKYFSYYIFGLVGGSLCHFDVGLSDLFTFTILLLVILVCIFDTTKLKKYEKLYFGIIFLIVFLLIYTSLYVQWSPVGLDYVNGVQGRYFIPLLIPIFILTNATKLKYDLENKFKYMYLVMIFIDLYALITLFYAHAI